MNLAMDHRVVELSLRSLKFKQISVSKSCLKAREQNQERNFLILTLYIVADRLIKWGFFSVFFVNQFLYEERSPMTALSVPIG